MASTTVFLPPRRRGLILHAGAGAVLAILSITCLVLCVEQGGGGYFVLLLLLSLFFFVPLPFIFYSGYAFMRGSYSVERDGLRLRWGLRAEDIPIRDVEWVRPVSDLGFTLPLPFLHLPGAVLGHVRTRELGVVEFMASDIETMLLVATPGKVYAISPEDPRGFVKAFRNTFEMGSLQPLASRSVQPTAYLARVWQDPLARWAAIAGLGATILLFILVGLVIPGRALVSLGFSPDGLALEPVPSAQMLLLPVLGAFAFTMDLVSGLFFYRANESKPVAYLLWGSGVVTPLLLIIGAWMLL
jgi:hypothetical protein